MLRSLSFLIHLFVRCLLIRFHSIHLFIFLEALRFPSQAAQRILKETVVFLIIFPAASGLCAVLFARLFGWLFVVGIAGVDDAVGGLAHGVELGGDLNIGFGHLVAG